MKYRYLGKTDLQVSALGLGMMRLPIINENSEVDQELSIDLLRYAINKGINYIDTAFTYHNGISEEIVGRAIKGIERNRVILATKCPVWEINIPSDFEKILEVQLERLNTDYIDCYLFHALGAERWEHIKRLGLLEKMEKAKEKGLIRHIGFSFHDGYDVLKKIIDEYDNWEFCQLQYNYVDTNKQAGIQGVSYVKEKGLGLVVMEPLHGGRLVVPPIQVQRVLSNSKSAVEWALDFLFDQKEVDIVLSGMSDKQQIDENITYTCNAYVNMLSKEEKAMFNEAKRIYNSMSKVLCTSCGYCLPCSQGINIPKIMKAYNRSGSTNYRNAKLEYDKIDVNAGQCIHCHICEKRCPQRIEISNEMDMIKETFDAPLPDIDEDALRIKWPERYKELFKI